MLWDCLFVEAIVPLMNYECSLKFCSAPWSGHKPGKKEEMEVLSCNFFIIILGLIGVNCSCIPAVINLATLHFLIHTALNLHL